jgi:hypothetical protein
VVDEESMPGRARTGEALATKTRHRTVKQEPAGAKRRSPDAMLSIAADLALGKAADGTGRKDKLVNIDGVLGSAFDDAIRTVQASALSTSMPAAGGAGKDALWGGAGADTTAWCRPPNWPWWPR